MDLGRWVKDSVDNVHSHGLSGGVASLREPWYKLLKFHGGSGYGGENIYKSDWDVLILIDACRADLVDSVSSEYDFLGSIESKKSVASMTPNWMDRTFVDEFSAEISETTYICGNPYSEDHAPESMFADLHEPWRTTWSDDEGTLPARPVTDRAIRLARDHSPDRLLIHYMQPHHPFIGGERLGEGIEVNRFGHDGLNVWSMLELGRVEKDAVWDAYRGNLRYVLDDVELLLQNIDASRVVITSDHGNAIGEWGVYGHPANINISALRDVPWVETSAVNNWTHQPTEPNDTTQEIELEDQLRALGYTK